MRITTRITTPTLAAALLLGLTGGAFAQGAAVPGAADRAVTSSGHPAGQAGKAVERTGNAPAGNPSQDTTGAIGHPKSNNSNGATTAPAAR